MQCEMCGKTVRGAPKLVRVEGAELQVCSKCAKFGTEVQQVRRMELLKITTRGPAAKSASPATSAAGQTWHKRDMFDFMGGEVVEDYAARIKQARMEKGLSQKDLAMQMKEKEQLIKKIENTELIPEENVRKKLEKVLEIQLIDAPSEVEAGKKVTGTTTPTLGDLTIIRKAKK
ncbi:MAG: multiprotein bridging factor aMBF1 [Methanomicrobiales archaeon]